MITYKIGEVLTDKDGCSRVKMEEDTAGEWVRKQDVQELLRKQREACAKDARIVVLSYSNIGVVKKVQEAILNAEATP
jgi:hypothetical protein